MTLSAYKLWQLLKPERKFRDGSVMSPLKVGDKVLKSGYPGIVRFIYSATDEYCAGMVEVSLASGRVIVPVADLVRVPS